MSIDPYIQTVEKIHGHRGRTTIVYLDE